MSTGRGNDVAGSSNAPITDTLLQVPENNHRMRDIANEDVEPLSMRQSRRNVLHHPYFDDKLVKMGLYQVDQMEMFNLDRALITALVQRWRPEMHSFHMPTGEMTITLQDVAILWGLPIKGEPVTGVIDMDWTASLEKIFGPGVGNDAFKVKKVTRKDGSTYNRVSKYHLRLRWLDERFHNLPNNEDQLYQNLAGYIMELIGTVLLPDGSGDCMSLMYCQFLYNLDEPIVYNWGAAVLACLYRNLCRAAWADAESITGPLMFLQKWTWTHFYMGRPKVVNNYYLEDPDLEYRHAYGIVWCGKKRFRDNPYGKVSFYIKAIEELRENDVNWEPYRELLDEDAAELLPLRVLEQSDVWWARIHLVHFWMVECHYPDRVMRQLGAKQVVHPPAPEPWEETCKLHELDHDPQDHRRPPRWDDIHATYIREWDEIDRHSVDHSEVYDSSGYHGYMLWFVRYGCITVHTRERILARFPEQLPLPSQPVSSMPVPPRHDVTPRLVERMLREAAYGLKLMVSKASKKVGKFMLRTCHGNLDDIGHGHRLDALLETHRLPMDIDSRQSSGEVHQMPDPPSMEDMANFYVGYLPPPGGPSVDAGTSASADVVFGPGAQLTPAPVTHLHPYVVGSTTQRRIQERANRPNRGEPPDRYSPE